jgi:hypothetical protein
VTALIYALAFTRVFVILNGRQCSLMLMVSDRTLHLPSLDIDDIQSRLSLGLYSAVSAGFGIVIFVSIWSQTKWKAGCRFYFSLSPFLRLAPKSLGPSILMGAEY